jgi:hypothetical protein
MGNAYTGHSTIHVRGENCVQAKASPYHDFGPLKLGFEGIASAMEAGPLQYMIIQPVNYLIWDVRTRALQLYRVHIALF